jgi:predicted nuclease of predicted toxin-antitoxin system
MRLLFDQNISFRVVKQLKTTFPEVTGVRESGLVNADDYEIWEYARQNNYTVVSFDKDIPDIGSVKGYPPKIVWLRTGNMSNQAILALFLDHAEQFAAFIANEKNGCLMVYPTSAPGNQTTEE